MTELAHPQEVWKVEMASNAALQAVDSRASSLSINLSNKRNTKLVMKILATARTKKRTKRKMIPRRRLNDPCYIDISMEARITLLN
jgi:hypothetical protein